MSIETETVFPWHFAEEVFDLLQQKQINVIRYRDLEIHHSKLGSRFRYFDEYIKFKTGKISLLSAIRAVSSLISYRFAMNLPFSSSTCCEPPVVILQHDADLLPDRTLEMMQREKCRGLFSSNYLFVQHADDASYMIDVEKFQQFEKDGFEIGYHLNAYERADYDEAKAYKIVSKDLDWLEDKFHISSFVPHGGTPSSDGRNNNSLKHKERLKPLEWTFNGRCILKEYTWTDGGIKKRTISDPRQFIHSLKLGTRAMMLMHPQYYGNTLRHDWEQLPISREKWWRDLWGL